MTFQPKHLVVPVDCDPAGDRLLAEHLVDDAMELAGALGARVTLVHVALAAVQAPVLPPDASGEVYRTLVDVLEERNIAAGKALTMLRERALVAGARHGTGSAVVDTALIRTGGTVPELLVAAAQELQGELIVMATHGRKGLQRLLLGSVAERTAHRSPIPVLLLPAHR